jgi:uncharacterized protein YukJ
MPSAEEIERKRKEVERKRQDLIKNYGVWVARPVWFNPEREGVETPHVYLKLRDTQEDEVEAALNVGVNGEDPENSQLVYRFEHKLDPRFVEQFKKYEDKPGFHQFAEEEEGLDYERDVGLIDIRTGDRLQHDIPGRGNDILDRLLPLLKRSIEEKAVILVFGSQYEPRSTGPSQRGLHNIHMNQGSGDDFPNVIHRDGAIFFHFEKADTWSGLFLAFASQRLPTDEDGKPKKTAKTLETLLDQ